MRAGLRVPEWGRGLTRGGRLALRLLMGRRMKSASRFCMIGWRGFLFTTVAGLAVAAELGTSRAEIIPVDRRINWSVGIPGGIPVRTNIFASVKAAPYSAHGDGVTDDTAA